MHRMETPVAFFFFNRPEITARVFSQITRAEPSRLFLIADGPRENRPADAEQCAAARRVVERIDWPCRVHTNFAPRNMGCMQRMASGISWVFDQVDEAIILEDDCLPDPTFFRFCEDLLRRYRDEPRVMQIGGFNIPLDRRTRAFSYYFSRFGTNWGWATWRRAWSHYDVDVKEWPTVRDTPWLLDIVKHPSIAATWTRRLDLAHRRELGTWDYQWLFACWRQRGLSVQPTVSMISNLGYGGDATHTISSCHDPRADVRAAPMPFPLRHPEMFAESPRADRIYKRQVVLPSACDQGVITRMYKKWWEFRAAHPSVRSWKTFSHRLREKVLLRAK
jgi:hypothetical protein